MTLAKQVTEAGFVMEPAPGPSGGLAAVVQWCVNMFQRLQEGQAQPHVQGIQFGRIEIAGFPPGFKPEVGMLIYAAGSIVGPGRTEGLYLYASDLAWHQISMSPGVP